MPSSKALAKPTNLLFSHAVNTVGKLINAVYNLSGLLADNYQSTDKNNSIIFSFVKSFSSL
ncbi:hypothetical protein [Megamonas funiformis]|uniref:hypothetical protein n=1 Tax=Megamonas funiformis TaxID=437897 RepID=UPI001CD2AE6C|nr:hypothetical protein [Megamonas funiformis]UBS49331.1 hypothetical protein LCQ45_02140 [Megamonas funiformis]GLU97509.1 hypothetical protein Mfun01_01540 [Megamonas funiformis]